MESDLHLMVGNSPSTPSMATVSWSSRLLSVCSEELEQLQDSPVVTHVEMEPQVVLDASFVVLRRFMHIYEVKGG